MLKYYKLYLKCSVKGDDIWFGVRPLLPVLLRYRKRRE